MEYPVEVERDEHGFISGVVRVEVGEIVHCDLERFLDLLSERLTGTELLMEVNYDVVGYEGDTLLLKVTGDPSMIEESEED